MVPPLHNFRIANILSFISIAISLAGVAMQIICGWGITLYVLAGFIAIGGFWLYMKAIRTRKHIAKRLGEAILGCKELYMRDIKTDETYAQWRNEFTQWCEDTKTFIEDEISKEASIWFINITGSTAGVLRGAYGGQFGEHNGLLKQLDAFLEKLGELLSRY